MNKITLLRDLIESMSPSEIRYFRTRFRAYSNSDEMLHLDLFNELCSKKKQDKALQSNTSLSQYLYDQILLSLRTYHADKSLQVKYEGLLLESILLFDRGLDQHAIKRVKEAEKLARSNYELLDVLRARKLHSRLLKLKQASAYYSVVEKIHEDNKQALQAMLLENEVLYYNDKIIFYRNSMIEKKTGEIEYKQLLIEAFNFLQNTALTSIHLTINSRIAIESIHYYYHSTITKKTRYEKKHLANILKLFEEEFPILTTEHIRSYMSTAYNYITHCIRAGKLKEANKRIIAFKKMKSRDIKIQQQLNLRTELFLQQLYLHDDKLEGVIDQYKRVEKEDKTLLDTTMTGAQRVTFIYNVIVAYVLEATSNHMDFTKKKVLLLEVQDLVTLILNNYDLKDYQKEITKTMVMGAVIFLEQKNETSATSYLVSAANRCHNNSDEQKIIRRLLSCCDRPISDRWSPLKRIYQRKYKISDWMEELNIWMQRKLK